MIKKIDITNPKFAKEVLDVQIPSYKVEADLIGFDEIPPLKDTVDTLQQCGENFYGCYINEELSGVISIKIENGVMDIHRLFVHPKHFRRGIGKMLLDFIQTHENGFETIIVSTGSKNEPAINFYQKNGFSKTKERKVTEGLLLTFFNKKI
ncbi:GNAT family N-acetyltransferase [Neobacillus cucumis]|uniref:GNAT family N-acetyltransferase n=1 Tax=Neobacillus cucumis TaxID=1740721 RepID=UPI0028533A98|nr:GNAT family N-acetyltransferase [Neobacillus cucumis]MDR4947894.1 GNAT family N-acetyltransferase [Neobacillus cucumis]